MTQLIHHKIPMIAYCRSCIWEYKDYEPLTKDMAKKHHELTGHEVIMEYIVEVQTNHWYKENIEKPIRSIVKFLRENGINTTWSCGHEMWIQFDKPTHISTYRIAHILESNGIHTFRLEVAIEKIHGPSEPKDQCWIWFPKPDGKYSNDMFESNSGITWYWVKHNPDKLDVFE